MDIDLKEKNNLMIQELRKQESAGIEHWSCDPCCAPSESNGDTESSLLSFSSSEQLLPIFEKNHIKSNQRVLIDLIRPQPKHKKSPLASLITRIIRRTCNFFRIPHQ